MLIYIHTHDADDLSLKDIADAGTMSIAQCNRCFNKMLNVTEISDVLDLIKGMHFIQVFKITKEISNDGGLR